jgi:hypothetical protein
MTTTDERIKKVYRYEKNGKKYSTSYMIKTQSHQQLHEQLLKDIEAIRDELNQISTLAGKYKLYMQRVEKPVSYSCFYNQHIKGVL